jgi:tetratricopeptide (TPR) repeat protein
VWVTALAGAGALVSVAGQPAAQAPGFDLRAARAAAQALAELPTAQALFQAGDYERAGQAFERALERLPAESHAATASALLNLGPPERFLELRARLLGNLGVCRLRARRYEEAVGLLRAARDAEPRRARHRANLGVTLLRLRRYDEARAQLERAVALGARDGKLLLDLAEAHLRAGELSRARAAAQGCLRLQAQASGVEGWGLRLEAEELLAEADWSEGHLAGAEARLRRVLAWAPGRASARQRLAQVLLRAGRTGEAARQRARFERDAALTGALQSALAARPGRVDALRFVAYAYEQLGLLHLAQAHYRQLLARAPRDQRLRVALRRLERRAALASKGDPP